MNWAFFVRCSGIIYLIFTRVNVFLTAHADDRFNGISLEILSARDGQKGTYVSSRKPVFI